MGKQEAQEIRKGLKAIGYSSRKVSVRYESLGSVSSAIRVKIKSPDVDINKVREVAQRYEHVSRCESTGEILGGGNTYLDVEWSDAVIKAFAGDFAARLAAAPKGAIVEFHGWKAYKAEEQGYFQAWGPGRPVHCWGAEFCAKQVAQRILES